MGPRKLFLLLALLGACAAVDSDDKPPRSAHWVIRSTDLQKTVEYYKQVLGMRVLRHEENEEPCPITCNGDSPTPWSKTMLGTVTEDEGYAIEVTYNYGVDAYARGSGLHSIFVVVEDVDAAMAKSKALGYPCRRTGPGIQRKQVGAPGAQFALSAGPDKYRYILIQRDRSAGAPPLAATNPFAGVKLNVANLPRALAFYTQVLGMTVLPLGLDQPAAAAEEDAAAEGGSAGRKPFGGLAHPAVEPAKGDVALGFGDDKSQTLLVLNDKNPAPKITTWEGRHAIALPAAQLQAIYAKLEAERPELIVHEMQELQEPLGTLFIAILKDEDGFELCLVSSETFDGSVRDAADFKEPDWAARDKLVAKRQAEAAVRANRAYLGALGGADTSAFVPLDSDSDAAVSLAASAAHVARHVWDAMKDATYSKKEGNFFASGVGVGFVSIFAALSIFG